MDAPYDPSRAASAPEPHVCTPVSLSFAVRQIGVTGTDATDRKMVYNRYEGSSMYALALRQSFVVGTPMCDAVRMAVVALRPTISAVRRPPFVAALVLVREEEDETQEEIFYLRTEDVFRLQCHLLQRQQFRVADVPAQMWHQLTAFGPNEMPALAGNDLRLDHILSPHLYLPEISRRAHLLREANPDWQQLCTNSPRFASARWFFLQLVAFLVYSHITCVPLEAQAGLFSVFTRLVRKLGDDMSAEPQLQLGPSVLADVEPFVLQQSNIWESVLASLSEMAGVFLYHAARLYGLDVRYRDIPRTTLFDLLPRLLVDCWMQQSDFAVLLTLRPETAATPADLRLGSHSMLLPLAGTLLEPRQVNGLLMRRFQRVDLAAVHATPGERLVNVLLPDTMPVFLGADLCRTTAVAVYNTGTCVFDTLLRMPESDFGALSILRLVRTVTQPRQSVTLYTGWVSRVFCSWLTEQRTVPTASMRALEDALRQLLSERRHVKAMLPTVRECWAALARIVDLLHDDSAPDREANLTTSITLLKLLWLAGFTVIWQVTPNEARRTLERLAALPDSHPTAVAVIRGALEAETTAPRNRELVEQCRGLFDAHGFDEYRARSQAFSAPTAPRVLTQSATAVALAPPVAFAVAQQALFSKGNLNQSLVLLEDMELDAPVLHQPPVRGDNARLALHSPTDTLPLPNPRSCNSDSTLAAVLMGWLGPALRVRENKATEALALMQTLLCELELHVRPLNRSDKPPGTKQLFARPLNHSDKPPGTKQLYEMSQRDASAPRLHAWGWCEHPQQRVQIFTHHSDLVAHVSMRDSACVSDWTEQATAEWMREALPPRFSTDDVMMAALCGMESFTTPIMSAGVLRRPCEALAEVPCPLTPPVSQCGQCPACTGNA